MRPKSPEAISNLLESKRAGPISLRILSSCCGMIGRTNSASMHRPSVRWAP